MSDRHAKRDPVSGKFLKRDPSAAPAGDNRIGQVKESKKRKTKAPSETPAPDKSENESANGPDMFDGSLIIEL